MSDSNAPRIERLSDDEVYLLSPDGIRTKRICGKIRDGIPEAYPCVKHAGEGTRHSGVGPCAEHETSIEQIKKSKNFYEIVVDKEDKRTVLDYIAVGNSAEMDHHTSLDSEIEIVEALVAKLLATVNVQSKITPKQVDDISKVIEKLGKLKKIKIDAMKREKLDTEVIAKFLGNIMSVIKMHTQGETTKRIILDIITNVVVPMMNREEMGQMPVNEFKELVGMSDR